MNWPKLAGSFGYTPIETRINIDCNEGCGEVYMENKDLCVCCYDYVGGRAREEETVKEIGKMCAKRIR